MPFVRPAATAIVLLAAAAAPALGRTDAAALFAQNCAACHGPEGRGLPDDHPLLASFSTTPATLDDPLFNSREPAADWRLVVEHGGASIGLSSTMPAFGHVLSSEEIDALVDYVKTLAETADYPPGDLNFIRPHAVTKAFPEDEALIITRYEAGDGPRALRNTLYFARRFGSRNHVEVKLNHVDQGERSELSEVEIEVKRAVAWDGEAGSIHTLGLELAIPIEGDGSEELIPYWSFGQALGDRAQLQTQVAAKLPLDHVDEGEAVLEAALQWLPSPWPRSAIPGIELTLTEPFSDGDTAVTAIPQVYFGLSRLGHVAFSIGAELPLTDEAWDYRIRTFLLWDIADGPITGGW